MVGTGTDCSELHCYQRKRLEALALSYLIYSQYKRFSNSSCQNVLYESMPCNQVLNILKQMFLFYRQLKSWMLMKDRSCFVCRLCLEEIHKGRRRRLSRFCWGGAQWFHLNMSYCLKLPLQPDLAVSALGPCGNFHPGGAHDWRFEQCRHQLDTYPRQGWGWL